MNKVMFVCHGNICRSPMAEFVLRDKVERLGLGCPFLISSTATSAEEIGNPVHPGTRKLLAAKGISTAGKTAKRFKKTDYDSYDYVIAMDQHNLTNILRMVGGDPNNKVCLLLDFTDRPGPIADPWFTGDFESTYRDVAAGCDGLLIKLIGCLE